MDQTQFLVSYLIHTTSAVLKIIINLSVSGLSLEWITLHTCTCKNEVRASELLKLASHHFLALNLKVAGNKKLMEFKFENS